MSADPFFALVQQQRELQAAWFKEIREQAQASGQSDYDYAVANNLFTGTREEFVAAQTAALAKSNNLSDLPAPAEALTNIGAPAKKDIDGVASFAALRTRAPKYDGERIWLSGWNAGVTPYYGGGRFVGHIGNATDDGGVIAAGSGFYWRREVHDYASLNVTHFGAIPDNNTDSTAAVLAMFRFGYTNDIKSLGVNFPSGKFVMSTAINLTDKEYSHFKMCGPRVEFGYMPSATITFKGAVGYAITIKARRTEIHSLALYGGTKDTAEAAGRGFFKNLTPGGAFTRVSCLYVESFGGPMFDLLDTLDTKFDQCYGQYLYAGFITGGWSDQEFGTWDHMTAVEITNINFHLCYRKPVIYLPRCPQSIMTNCWIEQSEYGVSIPNGEWVITQLNMEGIQNPNNFTYAQITVIGQIGLQGASSISYDDPATVKWLSSNEMGRSTYGARGAFMHGTLACDYQTGTAQVRNDSKKDSAWFDIGTFIVEENNDNTVVRLIGGYGAELATGAAVTRNYMANDFGGGELRLRCRKARSIPETETTAKVDAYHDVYGEVIGTSPVENVRIRRLYPGYVQVWVRLRANSGNINCFIETTSKSRYTAGACFKLTKNFKQLTDAEFAALTTGAVNMQTAWGNGVSGFFVASDNVIGIKGKAVTDGLLMSINGVDRILPTSVFQTPPVGSDTFTRTTYGNINGTTVDNGSGGSAAWTWTATGADANTRAGGTLEIKTNTTARCVFRATGYSDSHMQIKLVSGPATTSDAVNATFDFRTASGAIGADAYQVQMFQKDATSKLTKLRLLKRVGGTTTIISPADSLIIDGQVLKVVCRGSNIKVYADSGLLWDVTDTSLPTGEVIGFGTAAGNTGFTVADLRIYP